MLDKLLTVPWNALSRSLLWQNKKEILTTFASSVSLSHEIFNIFSL